MTVDGKVVKPTITYKKRGSYTRFTLRYSPRGDLVVGSHTIKVRVTCRHHASSTKTWTFTIGVPQVPKTGSDGQASYEGTASIHLSAEMVPVAGAATVASQGAAIAHTYYRLDGAEAVEGTDVQTLAPESGDATHTLEFWSETQAGVAEPHQTIVFKVVAPPDTKAPRTSALVTGHSIGPDSYDGTVAVQLTAADYVPGTGVAATYSSIDGGAPVLGTTLVVRAPVAGSVQHVLRYWSVDAAGNVEPVNELGFDVAPEPVYVALSTASDVRSAYVGPALIILTPHGTGAGTAHTFFRFDGQPLNEGTQVSAAPPARGARLEFLEFWSVDADGNEESPHNFVQFQVECEGDSELDPLHTTAGSCVIETCHPANVWSIHARVEIPETTYCATCHGPGIAPTLDCTASYCHPTGMKAPPDGTL